MTKNAHFEHFQSRQINTVKNTSIRKILLNVKIVPSDEKNCFWVDMASKFSNIPELPLFFDNFL